MKRAFVPAAAAAGVVLVVVAAFLLGHQVASSGSVNHARAVTIAATGTGAAHGTTALTSGPSVLCALTDSGFAVAGHPGRNSIPGHCTVTMVTTSGNGEIELHWPGGQGTRPVTTTYVLGRPAR